MSTQHFGLNDDPFAEAPELTLEEATLLLRGRVTAAGGNGEQLFPAETCAELHRLARGKRGGIFSLAGRAMRIAAREVACTIEPAHVQAAAAEAGQAAANAASTEPAATPVAPARPAAREPDAMLEIEPTGGSFMLPNEPAEHLEPEAREWVGRFIASPGPGAATRITQPPATHDVTPSPPAAEKPAPEHGQDAPAAQQSVAPAPGPSVAPKPVATPAPSVAKPATAAASATPKSVAPVPPAPSATPKPVTAATPGSSPKSPAPAKSSPGAATNPAAPIAEPEPARGPDAIPAGRALSEETTNRLRTGGRPGSRRGRRGQRVAQTGLAAAIAIVLAAVVIHRLPRGEQTAPEKVIVSSRSTSVSPPTPPVPVLLPPTAAVKPAAGKTSAARTAASAPAKATRAPEPAKIAAPAPTSAGAAPSAEPAPERLGIEVATFIFADRAESERERLAAAGHRVRVSTTWENGSASYRVVLGSFTSWEEAERAADQLLAEGQVQQARIIVLRGRKAATP